MKNNVERFRKSHGLSPSLDLKRHKESIDALLEIFDFTYEWLGEIDNKTSGETFVILTYMNLSSRIKEQAAGMILCLAGKAWSSAEALSRVVLESSVSLLCLALDGGGAPIKGFFHHWLEDHTRRLEQWRKIEVDLGQVDVLRRIDFRIDALKSYHTFLDIWDEQITSVQSSGPLGGKGWSTNVRERFKRAGLDVEYVSTYHRMSNSIHTLAEDTLTWLALILTDSKPDHLHAAGKEAVAYSTMLTLIAMVSYVNSLMACCAVKGLKEFSLGERHRERLTKAIKNIAPSAGVPYA